MPRSSAKLILKAGYISLIFNGLLFIIKYWAGIVSGSIALIADAWHTVSDSFTSLIIIIGTKLSRKPADKEHPFGHGRIELIASIIVATMLAVIGFEFIIDAIQKIVKGESVKYGLFAIVVTIISVIVKELMAQYSFRVARKTNSQAVKADGWHHRSDSISSVIILAGIFLEKYIWWIDSLLCLIVALLLFWTAYSIIRETSDKLIGEIPDDKLLKELKRICKNTGEKNLHLHHIHIHRYGDHLEISFHIRLPKECSIHYAHELTNEIESAIHRELNADTTIHVEPLY